MDSDIVESPFLDPLVDTGFSGEAAEKKTFDDNPEVIVRYSPDEGWKRDDFIQMREELTALNNTYGIHVPKVEIVQGRELFAVTERVHGEELADSLSHATPEVIEDFQALNSGLLQYLADRSVPGTIFLHDIYGFEQYMVGTTAKNPKTQLYLVDIDPRLAKNKGDGDAWKQDWLRCVYYIANDILRAESLTGVKMEKIRQKLSEFNSALPKENLYSQSTKIIEDLFIAGGEEGELPLEEWLDKLYEQHSD